MVLVAGARGSKTTICVKEASYLVLQPKKNIWVVGVDYDKTHRFIFGAQRAKGVMDDIARFFPQLIANFSRARHYISFKNGSRVVGKSVLKEDTFIAEPVDLIVCEDAATFPLGFYDQYIRPRILDTGGRIFVNSVPPIGGRGTSFLYSLIQSIRPDDPTRAYFNWSAEENPNISREELIKLRMDLPPDLQSVIIDGKIPMHEVSIFGNIDEHILDYTEAPYIEGHIYQGGVDVGFTHDRTVLAITDITDNRLAYIDDLPQDSSDQKLVMHRIMGGLEKFRFPLTYFDVSGSGSIYYHFLKPHNFFHPILIRNREERNDLINGLVMAFSRGYKIPRNQFLVSELRNLEIVTKTGYFLYRPRSGYNDDAIMAVALSLKGFSDKLSISTSRVDYGFRTFRGDFIVEGDAIDALRIEQPIPLFKE